MGAAPVTLCLECSRKDSCQNPCADLEIYLFSIEEPPFFGPLFSEDLIERIFPFMPKEESVLQRERRQRKERKSRGRAIAELIDYFSALTKEEGKSLKYFFIWRMVKEENLKHWEIAEIMSISRQRITQIINEIEGKGEKGN